MHASTSTAPPSPLAILLSAPAYVAPPRAAPNGRVVPFVESPEQRALRTAFLRARRTADWVRSSVPSVHEEDETEDEPYIFYATGGSPYSQSSPSSSSSSLSSLNAQSDDGSPSTSPVQDKALGLKDRRRRSAPHGRNNSLSAISEVPEEN